MAMDISNQDDVIDSRDVIARIEELESEREDLESKIEDLEETFEEIQDKESEKGVYIAESLGEAKDALAKWDESEEAEELKALKALEEEAEGYAPDWVHGATLIRDGYFETYAIELIQDIGDLPKDIPGYLVIDWGKTAENIQVDYTSVDFDGVTYWVR